MWQPIRDAFKIVEASDIPKKNEQTYLMSIDACIELKDWKWARRFHSRGSQKLEFSPEFNEIVDSLRSDLTEEELKDFRLGKKDKQ